MTRKHERRSGADRRQNDLTPYSGKERRRSIDPRKPQVMEVVISEIEWELYFGGNKLQADAAPKIEPGLTPAKK